MLARRVALTALLAPACLLAQRAAAQRAPARAAAPDEPARLDSARFARTAPELRGLRWRLVGPFRGGRSVAVAGDPTRPRVFYFGAVNGGVWKTTSGGNEWQNVTDGVSNISSVGAIALAPSDPNVVYAGGGESDFREDWTYGDGMWRSTDAGKTWAHLGLDDARHIARIVVDPRDPDHVYVAAMGHVSGPNPMRGVYRSRDGGRSWQRILFLDDSTGAIDLAMDPGNPRILFAAMWRMRRTPWGFRAGAGRSGLWRSTDGGDTWAEITANPGMPRSLVGRIGVSVSAANPQRVYATIECPPEDSTGGIFRSDDAGATWTRTSGDQRWMVRPWYYSVIHADPKDQNTVYVVNLTTWKSIDGGRTWTRLRPPHGDNHDLWIDPNDSQRLISANDGGAQVSYDGGRTWSSLMNQPTAQFYHVTTDDRFPYRIYGAQQDNTTVSILSRSDAGVIGREDWYPVGGGESGYIAPKPGDPDIVVAGTYTGTMTRYDVRTRRAKDISVGLNNYDGWPAVDVPNRFQWTFPIVYSKHPSLRSGQAPVLYATANRVFRSTNDGDSWEAVSPDLTLHDPKTLGPAGGPVTYDMTGTEWYATIFAFAESPVTAGVLWAGSDDGLVHVSRDDAKSWQNVTPPFPGKYTRVSIIEPSHRDAGTAYLAANRYQQDDFHPYLYRTTDYGKTWTRIDHGIPEGAYTRTIREDPLRPGLLYVGTETGVWYSTDDGARWQPLQLNLPRVSVRDLHVHGSDLIAATHGRAFWVLDDVSPLRQMTDAVRGEPAHLFVPDTAIRFAAGGGFRTNEAGENPPCCAVVSYWIGTGDRAPGTGGTASGRVGVPLSSPQSPVPGPQTKLEFLDASGKVIRTFTSAEPKKVDSARVIPGNRAMAGDTLGTQPKDTMSLKPRGTRPLEDDTLAFAPGDSVVPARPGLDRFVWNLRYPATREVKDVINDEGTTLGPLAAPGTYTVRLTAGGRTLTQPLVVRPDPRFAATPAGYEEQLTLALQVQGKTNELSDAVGRIGGMERALDARTSQVKGQPYADRVSSAATALHEKLEALRDSLVEIHSHADQITLHYPVRYYNMLLSLADMVQSGEGSVTRQEHEVYADIAAKVDVILGRLRGLESSDVAAFNKLMLDLQVPAVGTGKAEVVRP